VTRALTPEGVVENPAHLDTITGREVPQLRRACSEVTVQ